jgi:hypothetical protein
MKIKLLVVLVCSLMILISTNLLAGSKSIFKTKHNLSVSGEGDIKSPTETRVCIFCHSSHNASSEGPLWNHQTTSSGKFQTYNRSTMVSKAELRGQSALIPMKNVTSSGKISASRSSHIGTDLRGTHPVSVKFNQVVALSSKSLRWPIYDTEKEVGTDYDGYVQCTSCHDPHDDSKSEKYPFWKKSTFSEVCKVCHKY